ncbi:glycosyltransferase family 2 protein [Pedobacter gandavensis]|uniref:Glycosyltransferase n=1 Tax=Pedobacter gandavensis TaxID=2679963 RepID=A0ABR6EX76_9SPHI|nr:glycosyltransferase family 2 protein [Pedobacter gandavensis]MBB2149897.1 glycosyltransferase [Pedobacter gandavensis]
MQNIKVSIITPSYNQGQFIEATINSVLNQTYKNIEYILLDACSTDHTGSVIERYKDRITKVICEKDKGQSDAINKGFKLATGELVAWINSDDILYPDAVERIVKAYLVNQDASIFYSSNYNVIDRDGLLLRESELKVPDREYLLRNKFDVLQPGSFYLTEKVRKVAYVDENIHYCMDLDLWLKLLTLGGIVDIEGTPTAAYREWELTKTSTGAEKFYKNIYDVLRKHGASLYDRSIRSVLTLYVKNVVRSKLKSS